MKSSTSTSYISEMKSFSDEDLSALEGKFVSVLVISSLLQKRHIPLTLTTLKQQVQQMSKDKNKILELSDLQCFVALLPDVCSLIVPSLYSSSSSLLSSSPSPSLSSTFSPSLDVDYSFPNSNSNSNSNSNEVALHFHTLITPATIQTHISKFRSQIQLLRKKNEKKITADTDITTTTTTTTTVIGSSSSSSNLKDKTNNTLNTKKRKYPCSKEEYEQNSQDLYPSKRIKNDSSPSSSISNTNLNNCIEIPMAPIPSLSSSNNLNAENEKKKSNFKTPMITTKNMENFEIQNFVKDCEKFIFYKNGCIASHRILPSKSPEFENLDFILEQLYKKHSIPSKEIPEKESGITPEPEQTLFLSSKNQRACFPLLQIPSEIKKALYEWKGIDTQHLYKHQCKAIAAILQGSHCIIATNTASGKSLCYTIPVLTHIIASNFSSKALYLFPTKALAQDQLKSLRELIRLTGLRIKCDTYDGDTPFAQRDKILKESHIILSNPDMIHHTLLTHYKKYLGYFFEHLSFVVLDECHSYHSVFGSHVSNVLKRLKRVVGEAISLTSFQNHEQYAIRFIGCSATIGNPLEHFTNLTGCDPSHICCVGSEDNSSGHCNKLIVFWNPPFIFDQSNETLEKKVSKQPDKDSKEPEKLSITFGKRIIKEINSSKRKNHRRSALMESALLFSQIVVCKKYQCLLFCKTRTVCELVHKYSLDLLGEVFSDAKHLIRSYRGGYLKHVRRQIEKQLFQGDILGVVATNALELGIDVGHLKVTLHIGYSGLASLWQQMGRCGRYSDKNEYSLSIFIAYPDSPLDQYIVNTPDMLFRDKHENVVISPFNNAILKEHILCAIADEPLSNDTLYRYWDECDNPKTKKKLDDCLLELNKEHKIEWNEKFKVWNLTDTYVSEIARQMFEKREKSPPHSDDVNNGSLPNNIPNYGSSIHPCHQVNIRNIGKAYRTFLIKVIETGECIDEMPERNAYFSVFEGAIYLNNGREYKSKAMNFDTCEVWIEELSKESVYYTKTRDRTDIFINNCLCSKYDNMLHYGNVSITTQIFGFWKINKKTRMVLDAPDILLPKLCNYTKGFWIDIPTSILQVFSEQKECIISACHGVSHAMISVMPLFIQCTESWFDTECPNPHDTRQRLPKIIISETVENGIGMMEEIIGYEKGKAYQEYNQEDNNKKELIFEIIKKTYQIIQKCPCTEGCPLCIQSHACHEYNIMSSKQGGLRLLQMLLQHFHLWES